MHKQDGIISNTQATKAAKPYLSRRHLFRQKLASRAWSVVRAVVIIGICFIIIYPMLQKISVSFMQEIDMYDKTVRMIPRNFTLDNYKIAINSLNYPTTFMNSLILSTLTGVLQVASATLVAYGFARFKFPGRGFFFGLVLISMIIPPQTIMVPLYVNFRYFNLFGLLKLFGSPGINLLDSYSPFALLAATATGLKSGLYIYILRQFFRGMPKELEESAAIDGASPLKTFLKIMLPSAVPMMVTVFLFSFVWQWNDSMYTANFFPTLRTLPLALKAGASLPNVSELGTVNFIIKLMITQTSSILVILPLIILYVFAQRFFIQSIERSGIVG